MKAFEDKELHFDFEQWLQRNFRLIARLSLRFICLSSPLTITGVDFVLPRTHIQFSRQFGVDGMPLVVAMPHEINLTLPHGHGHRWPRVCARLPAWKAPALWSAASFSM
jgi:hypothetical protein